MAKVWLMSDMDRPKLLCVLLLMRKNALRFFILDVVEVRASLILPPNRTQTHLLLVSLSKCILSFTILFWGKPVYCCYTPIVWQSIHQISLLLQSNHQSLILRNLSADLSFFLGIQEMSNFTLLLNVM